MIGETRQLNDYERAKSSGSFAQLSKGLTHYKLSGPSDGKVVVLIHGIVGPFGIWKKVADSLVSQGYRVIQYDLYGRGYSDRPDVNYDLDLFINQLSELLEVLSIRNTIYLVGWSLGGMIAVGYTSKYSDKIEKIILIAPAGVGISPPLNARIAMIPFFGEMLMRRFGRQIIIRSISKELHGSEHINEFRDLVTEQMQYQGYLRAFLSTLRYCTFDDATDDFGTIGKLRLSVLMISGSEDSIINPSARRRIRELIPHLQYREILDTGHMPPFERPMEVSRILNDFIASGSE